LGATVAITRSLAKRELRRSAVLTLARKEEGVKVSYLPKDRG